MFRVTIIWKALETPVTYVVMSEQKAWADVSEALKRGAYKASFERA